MPISSQVVGNISIDSFELDELYKNVIKVAIEAARPGIDVNISSESVVPGSINIEILEHLMYDSFVVVDVTYPNPNVFYELGIRNSCRTGTILY